MGKRGAFTLIELLLVIVIIALLISFILQTGGPIREAANRARCQTKLKGLADAYMAYTTKRGGQFPPYWHSSEWRGNDMYASWLPVDPNNRIVEAPTASWRSFNPAFGPLVFERMVKDADTFVCPAVGDSADPWWHELPKPTYQRIYYHDNMTNWDPIVSFEQWMKGNRSLRRYSSASYSLRFGLYPRSKTWLVNEGINAFLADNFHFHYVDEEDWDQDVIKQRHGSGVNVAYLDGSVQWRQDPIIFTDNYPAPTYRPLGNESGGDLKRTKMWKMWTSFDQKE